MQDERPAGAAPDDPNGEKYHAARERILAECGRMKDNSLALVEVFAPPDWVLRSSLGKADGQLYKNLYEAITSSGGCFERPEWFEEFTIRKPKLGSLKPKL